MLSQNTPYISRLDHLRFFAALLVIAYHVAGASVPADALNPVLVLVRQGESGVGLFMVLSGFILTRISLGKQISYGSFLYNRLVRIYPLYVFAIVVTAYTGSRNMDFLSIMSMLSTVGVVAGVNVPKFQQIWTIAVEFQFYLIFPFLVRFLGKHGARYIVGLVAMAVIVRGMMYITDGSIKDAAYWTIVGRIDQFCVGMLAAVVYGNRKAFFSSPLALAGALAVVYCWALFWFDLTGGFYSPDSARSALWIISPTVEALLWAVLALAYLEQTWPITRLADKTLAFLGAISFSLYIWHFPIIAAMHKVPGIFIFPAWGMNFALVVMPITVAVSSLSYFVIEKPFFAIRKTYVAPAAGSLPIRPENAPVNTEAVSAATLR